MITKITLIVVLILFPNLGISQNTSFVKSKAVLIGSIADSVFIASSSKVYCSMDYISNKVIVTFFANSFKTNITEKDSLLSSLLEHEIKIEFNADIIFDINNNVLNSKFKKTVGELEIDNESFEEPIEYKIANSPFNNNQNSNANKIGLKLTLKCDFILDKYFKNSENKEMFSPILEIEVMQATINKIN